MPPLPLVDGPVLCLRRRLEVSTRDPSQLGLETLSRLSGSFPLLQTLRLGPRIANPNLTLAGVFGALPSLTSLALSLCATSEQQIFSASNTSARCSRFDIAALSRVRNLSLSLQGFSDTKAMATVWQVRMPPPLLTAP